MIGAGIFALMGQAGAIAGSATYISFILAGIVAMLSGYSMARLGARYPTAGGIVEYLVQSFGIGLFSGALSILLYLSALVALALVAKTFGSYAVALMHIKSSPRWVNGLADFIIIAFVLINLEGAKSVARSEKLIVGLKVLVLIGFAVVGLVYARPALLSPNLYPDARMILFSLSVTFFAYEGFRVITNTAEDMPEPEKTLPRAMFLAISLVMVIYIAVALAVFGNLSSDAVIAAKDYALAEAAKPVFGAAGFIIISIAALVSTASSINANLYAVTNVTYQLAKDGELPNAFGQPVAHSREGLLISGVLIILLINFLNLSEIATVGAITILIVHFFVHLGHMKLRSETRAAVPLVILAALATLFALGFALYYALQASPHILWMVSAAILIAFLSEFILYRLTARRIGTRAS